MKEIEDSPLSQYCIWVDGGGYFGIITDMFMFMRDKPKHIMGYSAGVLVSVFIVCNIDIQVVIDSALHVLPKCSFGKMSKVIFEFVDNVLPHNAHLIAQHYVKIALGDAYCKTKIVDTWNTRNELIQCFIPMLMDFDYKDPMYHCLDATFAHDLDHYRNKKGILRVSRPTTIFQQIINMFTIDKQSAIKLYEEGTKHAQTRGFGSNKKNVVKITPHFFYCSELI
jgi:hypothetical protein